MSDDLRALASLLRSGLTLRQALMSWPQETGGACEDIRAVAQRVQLGYPLADALDGTRFEPLLRPLFELHLASGMDLARWLDHHADEMDEHRAFLQSARAASSGAALSGRMVAGLPLLFIPFTPMSRASLMDPLGLTMLSVGIALALAGLRWIGRLVPRAPTDDPVASLCGHIAALLQAGLCLSNALDLACAGTVPALGVSLMRVRALVRLGATWPEALLTADPRLAPVSTVLERATRMGSPLAGQLEELAAARRAESRRSFERTMKRAPVLMVVPLTCCILPSYALLGLGPFLRSISLG